MKTPISLIIDDPAPIISVQYEGTSHKFTKYGKPLMPTFPNSYLDTFCDIAERWGMRGKFSVVPMPGNKGDVVNGLHGVPDEELQQWLGTVRKRLVPSFSICPEMLTHCNAIDLESGEELNMDECQWSKTQDRTTLTPYIAKALSLLKAVGLDSIGVTSPWSFGKLVEEEYVYSISKAVHEVTGSEKSWLFGRSLRERPNARPWVDYDREGRILVAIPSTTRDKILKTLECDDVSEEFVSSVADELITADGKSGAIIDVLNTGGFPILITHWQCLISNGLGTGMRVLDEIGRRINDNLSDKVRWMSFEEIMDLVIENKEDYPRPIFDN